MPFAIRQRETGTGKRFTVDAVNQKGEGAVILRQPRTRLVNGKPTVQMGYELDRESIPHVQYLVLGLLNASEPLPEIKEMLEMLEMLDEEGTELDKVLNGQKLAFLNKGEDPDKDE